MAVIDRAGATNYFCNLASGLITGRVGFNISGSNPSISIGSVPETIWDFGGEYIFPADGTDPIDTVSSSNTLDTQNICVKGLDINGDAVEALIVLEGQNKVSLSTPLWRHNFSSNKSNTELNGDIHIYEDSDITNGVPDDSSKVRGFITQGENRSQQSVFTTPNGTLSVMYHIYPFLSNKQDSNIVAKLWTREFGEVRKGSVPFGINATGTSFASIIFPIPVPFAGKTDICPNVIESSANNVAVGIHYSLEIIDL